jgi:hypothetical protein
MLTNPELTPSGASRRPAGVCHFCYSKYLLLSLVLFHAIAERAICSAENFVSSLEATLVVLLLIGTGMLTGLVCALWLFSYRGLAILSGISLILSTTLLLFTQRSILEIMLCSVAMLVVQQAAYLFGIRWRSDNESESDC